MKRSLRHKVFVTEQIPQSGRGPLPDGSTRMWSPITSTLIMGRRDAVLVDPPLTTTQADEVGDWIAASGRELRQIYITHGHGDHWFGAIPLVDRFPGVIVRATEGTAKLMEVQNDPKFRTRGCRTSSRRGRSHRHRCDDDAACARGEPSRRG
jgi:glyoxylase-like metal-dependent hydrolase (beta-lactamase superfamily II)